MHNLTDDIILSREEANEFINNLIHPNEEAIKLGNDFIDSGNFNVRVEGERKVLYDDNIDLSFLDEAFEESCATLDTSAVFDDLYSTMVWSENLISNFDYVEQYSRGNVSIEFNSNIKFDSSVEYTSKAEKIQMQAKISNIYAAA